MSRTTTSAVKPSLLALAWPIFIEQLLHLTTGMVDTFMVSHISDDAVAALGTANQIVVLFVILFGFVGIGTSVVVTHHLGGGDRAGADRIAATAIGVNTWLGLLASLFVYFAAEPLLKLMQLSPALREYALPFLALMGGTLFLEAMNLAISAVLRAHGHTRDPMLVAIGQNILNIIGNAVLLFGLFGAPKMGVVGVALSTVFSRLVACLVMWALLEYRIHLSVRARDFFDVSRERLARILHIGLPAAGEQISWYLAFMTVTAFTARMGDQALATQSYAMQLVWVVVLCSVAIGLATEIVIGHLVGAGQFDEAYRQLLRSLRVGFGIALIVAALVALFAPLLLGIFTSDPAIIATGALLMRIGLILEPGRVFNIVVINSLRATGDARYPVLIGAFSMWCVLAFGSWLLGTFFGLGLVGVWIAMAADEWLRGMLMYRRWKQRKWLKYAQRTHAKVQAGVHGEPASA
ncbi:MATE family efflux transporter [Chitinimonas taiwanensis]|uniref:MATE family efflux transporter n=1 Tax=Chitinimonas taiwanensis TaxID=240412 RepID=UPI0035B276B9